MKHREFATIVFLFVWVGFTVQSTQLGHMERGQFTNQTFTGQA